MSERQPESPANTPTHGFAISLARALGGALIFCLPLIMTMEMWSFGLTMDRGRLAMFLLLSIPMLVRLSYYAGFEPTFDWKNDVVDAFVALAVGFGASAALLGLLHAPEILTSWGAAVGMIALQAVPASIGAMLAQAQLGMADEEREHQEKSGYGGALFLMSVGALFLAFNVAPTEEIVLLAVDMGHWQGILLMLVSLCVMHGFVYVAEFQGQEDIPAHEKQWTVFLRFTVVGYAIALLVSAYVLWTFGRTDSVDFTHAMHMTIVLSFPASIGAAAARLIL